ncbi:MAG: glycosyltransferase, partial [Alphaproteobacteria bacterium]|nr:glycosyltransferase [Alphaproteobacteria bacterium]
FMDPTALSVVLLGADQGRHSYRQELQELARHLPAGLDVKFMSNHDDMPVAYAMADIVVSCSTDPEAFGRVTAEALSMGRLVIGTNHGATPELCFQDQTGFLVPPSDSQALALMIQEVRGLSPEQVDTIRHEARTHIVRNFSLTRMAEQTIALYLKAAKL